MARTPSSPEPARSLPVAVAQSLYLLLGMIAVSALGGVLLAAFFLPAVSASSAVAEDGVALFESYPSELEVEPLNEASRIEAADGSLLATFYTENRIMVPLDEDRKSTRLNSSHVAISYAVFCLKKKKRN